MGQQTNVDIPVIKFGNDCFFGVDDLEGLDVCYQGEHLFFAFGLDCLLLLLGIELFIYFITGIVYASRDPCMFYVDLKFITPVGETNSTMHRIVTP